MPTASVKVITTVEIGGRMVNIGDYVADLDAVERHCPLCGKTRVEFRIVELRPAFESDNSAYPKALLLETGFLSARGAFYRRLAKAAEARAIISPHHFFEDKKTALVFYEGSAHEFETRRYYNAELWPEWTLDRNGGWVMHAETDSSFFVWVEGAVVPPPDGFEPRAITLEHRSCLIRQELDNKANVVLRGSVGCKKFIVLDNWWPYASYSEAVAARHFKVNYVVVVGKDYDMQIPKSLVQEQIERLRQAGYKFSVLKEDKEDYLQWQVVQEG